MNEMTLCTDDDAYNRNMQEVAMAKREGTGCNHYFW